MLNKVLFILKSRDSNEIISEHAHYSHNELSSGLHNSAKFVCDALNASKKIEAKLVHVQDNNNIDKEVSEYKPDIVIIEAFWVVPEKFEVLTKLHPFVKWIIRNHSELPFAAQEGIIMDWTIRYLTYPNVYVSGNSSRSFRDLVMIINAAYNEDAKKKVIYLPNIYPTIHERVRPPKIEDEYLDVACFGAIRPLKNHLIQAVAAIEFANELGKKLRFHVNGNRLEGMGSNSILKNLRLLFENMETHVLIEHEWYPHEQFISMLKSMDIGMQVSFSETFNIVGADMCHVGLPIITSKEVLWSPSFVHADPTETKDILVNMKKVWRFRKTTIPSRLCQYYLNTYSRTSLKQWLTAIKELCGN